MRLFHVPGTHPIGAEEPAGQAAPAGQSFCVGVVAPPLQYHPARHGPVPAAVVRLVLLQYTPGRHELQFACETAPVVLSHVLIGHGVGFTVPTPHQNPAGQMPPYVTEAEEL